MNGLLRFHTEALPKNHPERSHYHAYLQGDGALTLITDPPGAEVLLYQYQLHHRKLEPRFIKNLGKTPLYHCSIPMGSYLVELHAEGHEIVRYPVRIDRLTHWNGIPPGKEQPHPIWMPPLGLLEDDDCYVPAGWFLCGGDPKASGSFPANKVWLDSFVIKKFPITNRQYLDFLNDLVVRGLEKEVLRFAPRELGGTNSEEGALIYGRRNDGRFFLRPDSEGDFWLPQWPVVMIDWYCAQGYALWYKQKTQKPWRLLRELEWEKAARGTDGRFFTWGDEFDASRCSNRYSNAHRPLPAEVHTFPVDISPYDVCGMSGNVQDWCQDPYATKTPILNHRPAPLSANLHENTERVHRGGTWSGTSNDIRLSKRIGNHPTVRQSSTGFRLACSLAHLLTTS